MPTWTIPVAIEDFNKAITIQPDFVYKLMIKRLAYREIGVNKLARKISQAIALNPILSRL